MIFFLSCVIHFYYCFFKKYYFYFSIPIRIDSFAVKYAHPSVAIRNRKLEWNKKNNKSINFFFLNRRIRPINNCAWDINYYQQLSMRIIITSGKYCVISAANRGEAINLGSVQRVRVWGRVYRNYYHIGDSCNKNVSRRRWYFVRPSRTWRRRRKSTRSRLCQWSATFFDSRPPSVFTFDETTPYDSFSRCDFFFFFSFDKSKIYKYKYNKNIKNFF